MSPDPVAKFISRWSAAQAAERANYQLFLSELCDVLDVPRPDPATNDTAHNAYVFERAVTFHHRGTTKTTTGRIDLYKRDSFVLEAKQYVTPKEELAELSLRYTDDAPKTVRIARGTAAWDRAMLEALGQAERYARSLPDAEDPPPFLLVVDVGHVIELYSDFTQKGKNYLPFPDSRSHRIRLADLAQPEIRERLRAVWLEPHSLDPAKKAAAVTREVARYLAELAKSFEKNHDPKLVAAFLSRCLFCMFAEDVGLLPKDGFKGFLDSIEGDPGSFVPLAEQLFADMNTGGVSGLLRKKLLYFNGGLFADARALPVNGTQLGLLRKAASLEWRHVEPAIFGTLLERALSPDERHKLGAHYTPRAYVERLVLPTLIEPLREEWSGVRIAAVTLAQRGTAADLKKARDEVAAFHARLCAVRVLDPACGSGNFLYVALEQMKRLEGEVITLLGDLGGDQTTLLHLQNATVDPHQFLGLEINPRAAAIAELVLWIGYLQWHFRVHGNALPSEPVLRKFNNIENRDAVLAYDAEEFAKDEHGQIRYVWDRRTYRTDPVTGRDIPDDKAVIPLRTYKNPRPAEWPQADFIVGNPPFLGDKVMKQNLGEGYVDSLRNSYPGVPESADFVMFWWHKAANETLAGRTRRFGFITTNSIRQTFNRRVVQSAMDGGIHLTFAIPDHPWIDSAECAAVRIAMTVGASSLPQQPKLHRVIREDANEETGENDVQLAVDMGKVSADLSCGADVSSTEQLEANSGLSVNGMMLAGRGFVLTRDEALFLGHDPRKAHPVIKPLRNGRDLVEIPRDIYVIDLFGLSADDARTKYPKIFERVLTTVKPERDSNARPKLKKDWWLFGEPRKTLRRGLIGISRYIATVETAKHRIFQFLPVDILPEHKIVVIASPDAFHLGVLSCRIHTTYALAAGSTLEDRPVYAASRCFQTFPFPDCTEKQKERIRVLAEELDAHRKRAQQQHRLGLTEIYNVLEKLKNFDRAQLAEPSRAEPSRAEPSRAEPSRAEPSRAEPSRAEPSRAEPLSTKERAIHDAALVSTLKQLHDDLDRAVAEAYGWAWPLSDSEILEQVVKLNTQRAAEEAEGKIRWLRPEYQLTALGGQSPSKQTAFDLADATNSKSVAPIEQRFRKARVAAKPAKKQPWPKTLADRAKAIETALANAETPQTAQQLAKKFLRASAKDVEEILQTLVALGQAHESDTKGTYVR